MRDVCSGQATDGGLRDGRVDEELVLRKSLCEFQICLTSRGIEDLLRACLERRFKLERKLAFSISTAAFISIRHTIGIMSAGSLLRRCASCSLNAMRWVMSMSQ